MVVSEWASKNFRTGYIECEANCFNHLLRFMTFDSEFEADEDTDVIYVDVKLNPKCGFFGRVVLAFKYIFGIDTGRYGEYECSIIHKGDIPKMVGILIEMSQKKVRD